MGGLWMGRDARGTDSGGLNSQKRTYGARRPARIPASPVTRPGDSLDTPYDFGQIREKSAPTLGGLRLGSGGGVEVGL
jgi:hypothetical protein